MFLRDTHQTQGWYIVFGWAEDLLGSPNRTKILKQGKTGELKQAQYNEKCLGRKKCPTVCTQ